MIGRKATIRPSASFQIPEGTFGTAPLVEGVEGLVRGFKSRKERLGHGGPRAHRVDALAFQIPEGTFGTLPRRVPGHGEERRFKSRKERLGLGG